MKLPILKLIACTLMTLMIACGKPPSQKEHTQNWTNYVRIAGHGLNLSNIDNTITRATETNVFGIEVDNDIPGRYESFLDPTEKLAAIKAMADKAHAINNYSFVYIAGLECITANADQTEHTFFKGHPDWVQRKLTGEPAIFGGGTAFWIDEGDEDVWISPYALEWRKIYMERVRQIAATGIDGIFVDIPYWMTHFDGWEDSWASFDDYTVAAFKEKTGLNAKSDLKLGDFSDANFRKWVDFRIVALTNFMKEISEQAKSVNPECQVIAEIYPGIEDAAVRVGADVYELFQVVDVIAHEYSGGRGNAASKNPLDWFSRMAGMYTFRAFAGGKASWMLSYSWGPEQEKIVPGDAIKNLMLSNVMAGTNCWDAARHVMSGSNDFETRKVVYKWISDHEKIFYLPRTPIHPIGIYFSPKTRNYFADDFMASYKGVLYMFLQGHREFEIVTPRTLSGFAGEVLILPDVKCLSDEENSQIEKYFKSGKALVVTGESGKYDATGATRAQNPLHTLLEISDAGKEMMSNSGREFSYYPNCPGKAYFQTARQSFDEHAWPGQHQNAPFYAMMADFFSRIDSQFNFQSPVTIDATPFVSTQTAMVDGKMHVFVANYKGLKGKENAAQLPEENVRITFPAKAGSKVLALPYLGEVEEIASEIRDGKLACTIPGIAKGMVIWCE
ncbi:MAG TPA: hypothetical protein VGA99_03345 [bacterium]